MAFLSGSYPLIKIRGKGILPLQTGGCPIYLALHTKFLTVPIFALTKRYGSFK